MFDQYVVVVMEHIYLWMDDLCNSFPSTWLGSVSSPRKLNPRENPSVVKYFFATRHVLKPIFNIIFKVRVRISLILGCDRMLEYVQEKRWHK